MYTAQKQEIKYQKNIKRIKLIMKNKRIFILKHFSMYLDFLIAVFKNFTFFISKISLSDKANIFIIALITVVIIKEYIIWGIRKKIS